MAALCQCMVGDYLNHHPDYEGTYDYSDLANAAEVYEDCIDDGYVVDPIHGFKYQDILDWCNSFLKPRGEIK